MKVKLTRSVLLGDSDVSPTRGGTEVEMDDAKAKEFISLGLATEVGGKKAAEPENKMAKEPANKAKK